MERNATPTLKATSLPARGWEFVVVWDPPGRWFKLVNILGDQQNGMAISTAQGGDHRQHVREFRPCCQMWSRNSQGGRTATISHCDGTLELLESLAADAYT
jgi:hypothetical protein